MRGQAHWLATLVNCCCSILLSKSKPSNLYPSPVEFSHFGIKVKKIEHSNTIRPKKSGQSEQRADSSWKMSRARCRCFAPRLMPRFNAPTARARCRTGPVQCASDKKWFATRENKNIHSQKVQSAHVHLHVIRIHPAHTAHAFVMSTRCSSLFSSLRLAPLLSVGHSFSLAYLPSLRCCVTCLCDCLSF